MIGVEFLNLDMSKDSKEFRDKAAKSIRRARKMLPGSDRESMMHVAAGYKHFAQNEGRSTGEPERPKTMVAGMAETRVSIIDALRGQQAQLRRLLAQKALIKVATKPDLHEIEAQIIELKRLLSELETVILGHQKGLS